MPAELPKIIENLMEIARLEAYGARAEAIEPVHLFIAVCKQCIPPIQRALESLDRDPVRLRRRVRRFAQSLGHKIEGEPRRVSSRVLGIVNAAKVLADAEQHPLSPCEVLRALIRNPDRHLAAVIKGEEISVDELDEILRREGANLQSAELTLSRAKLRSIIDEFGKDYTAMAREGKIDPVIGRRQEIKQIVRVLLRKQKNNPVLVGDPGVGKTSLVEGLALLATKESAPPELRRMRIVEIQIASLVAGTRYRGDFEERLLKLAQDAGRDPNLVVFFDEIHTLIGAGANAMDAGSILKSALARGAIRCIGATTFDEYRRHIEKDPALERRFQPIHVEEPTPEEAREILVGLRPTYEKYHEVVIADEALDAAVSLSVRYLTDRRLPDKARDLIDQAAVNKRFMTFSARDTGAESHPSVTAADIASVVAEWSGIPVERLATGQQERMARIGQALRWRVVGQDLAIDMVSRVVHTADGGPVKPESSPWRLPLHWPYGRGQNRTGQGARRISLRRREPTRPVRHVRISGRALGGEAHRFAAGLCRTRGRWPAHRCGTTHALLRRAFRRDRESSSQYF